MQKQAENFLESEEGNKSRSRRHREPSKQINPGGSTLGYMVIKMEESRDKERMAKAAKRKPLLGRETP